ncbi:MAG: hypothetical protein JSV18_05510 [Candidatus Bathyarchaeota archaeon]|nr:MAG: hypothetical protein JSV18_05510 [Candidatus Bathyarchaeota archaeon]
MTIERTLLYLEAGAKGTAPLIEAVLKRVQEDDLSSVVVASTKGKTALKLGEALKGAAGVVSVTEFTYGSDIKKAMKKLKIAAVEKADLPIQDRREMREALEIFGAGVKAALEVVSIAAEKGLVEGRTVAVAGTKGGLDTALVVRAAKPEDFGNPDPEKRIAVLEILALPKP